MAHEHKLEIFRGLWKFKSNTQKIWGVLAFLTLVTAVEVILGIYKPDFLMHTWIDPIEGGFFATLVNIILSPFIMIFVAPNFVSISFSIYSILSSSNF